jgi:hypothetical protein
MTQEQFDVKYPKDEYEIYSEQAVNRFADDLKKSEDTDILEKGKKDLSKLQKKTIVGKDGKRHTVWVKKNDVEMTKEDHQKEAIKHRDLAHGDSGLSKEERLEHDKKMNFHRDAVDNFDTKKQDTGGKKEEDFKNQLEKLSKVKNHNGEYFATDLKDFDLKKLDNKGFIRKMTVMGIEKYYITSDGKKLIE